MGGVQSTEDAEGAVARCRERKRLLRAAVAARHALAGAHAGHAAALKNVGAALSDYASWEAHDGVLRSASAAAALWSASGAAKEVLALPPPPPPPWTVEESPPLVRSMSAPDLPPIKKKPSCVAAIIEEEDDAEREGDGEDARRPELEEEAQLLPPPPPPPQLPPPTRSPPPLPPETRGFVDHSARVMQVITWNRLFKGIPQPENVRNELDDDEWETHTTILDKLLAWEKKLCDEVKEFVVIKMAYQQKLAVLNKKKQQGVSSSSLEKTKSVVCHLHTKYVVDMQTMESTTVEINRLRDQLLYPKLLELVEGMGDMWDAMYTHHKAQLRTISELKSFDISVAARETSEQHHDRTVQLWNIVQEWHAQFDKFVTFQKDYVGSLYGWIELNVIPIDTNLKPNSSQPHETTPPIKRLLHAWHDILGKLPDEAAKKAIHTFAEVIRTILVHQEDELKLRIKIEETRRDHERKRRQFEDWARNYMEKTAGVLPEDNHPDGERADPVVERKAAVERLELSLKDLDEEYIKQCRVVREKSLNLLRTKLPEVFRVVSDFSLQSVGMFKGLWSIANTNDQLDE